MNKSSSIRDLRGSTQKSVIGTITAGLVKSVAVLRGELLPLILIEATRRRAPTARRKIAETTVVEAIEDANALILASASTSAKAATAGAEALLEESTMIESTRTTVTTTETVVTRSTTNIAEID